MHLSKNGTLSNETALKGSAALCQNVLLLWNTCVGENKKKHRKVTAAAHLSTKQQKLSIEKDTRELKQTVSDMQDYIKEKQNKAARENRT